MEPPNTGHFGAGQVVLCREVVLFSEVQNDYENGTFEKSSFIKIEVIPFSEGPLSEFPLYYCDTSE